MPTDFDLFLTDDAKGDVLTPHISISTAKELNGLMASGRLTYGEDKTTLMQSTDIAVTLYRGLRPFKIIFVSQCSPNLPSDSKLLYCICGSQVLRAIEKVYRPDAYNLTDSQQKRFDALQVEVIEYKNIPTEKAHEVKEFYDDFGVDAVYKIFDLDKPSPISFDPEWAAEPTSEILSECSFPLAMASTIDVRCPGKEMLDEGILVQTPNRRCMKMNYLEMGYAIYHHFVVPPIVLLYYEEEGSSESEEGSTAKIACISGCQVLWAIKGSVVSFSFSSCLRMDDLGAHRFQDHTMTSEQQDRFDASCVMVARYKNLTEYEQDKLLDFHKFYDL
ncbi:hypothetical protein CPB83DRAFT_900517 [Crepidotus variabilis]|uniref:Uncharacterized protein n=1 Tax=Crepidotus variabilis TaxID=179855 RepID=A0A9P6E330_9AGAR|nr:hypothetical protein CPB83DRAFT_900517 [Crepidotus variabilis]